MLSFLKVFVRGLVCTVLLPVILLVWVLYGVYCLIVFVIMLVKSAIVFFAGDNAAGEMKEDIEAKRILLEVEQSKFEQAQVMNMMYQNMAAQQQMMQQQMMQQSENGEPQEKIQESNDFDPFTPDPVPENPTTEENEEGGNDNGQSY